MQKPSSPDSSKFDLKTEPDSSSQYTVEPDSSKLDQLKTKISSQSAKLITFAKAKGPLPFVIAGIALLAIVTIIILAVVYHRPSADIDNQNPGETQPPDDNQQTSNSQSSMSPSDQPDAKVPVFIDLQPTVNAWLKTTPANVGPATNLTKFSMSPLFINFSSSMTATAKSKPAPPRPTKNTSRPAITAPILTPMANALTS